MPPKGPPREKMVTEEILSAVVVADSFNKRFMPLTLEKPRCLLPLMNVPLIEYTLEFLAVSGVQKIFVVCCAHADMIKDYLKKSRWGRSTFPEVVTIVSQELQSVGDALRDIDGKQLIQSDFILVSGDVVSSMNLEKALEEHRARRVVDKSAIMTMVVKKASPNHRSRSRGEEGIFVINPNSHECVMYKELYPRAKDIPIKLELFSAHHELEFRNDFIDCQIDICSVDVPALFTENFDNQEIRKHFVKGILESDLLGKKIYCHLIDDKYAARVRSTQMYDAISNILEGDTYTHSRPQMYKESDVKLARSAVLKGSVLIGSGTSIGEGAVISRSSIGRNCKIGPNVILDGAYIWDNVTISDGCHVSQSILANDVFIGEKTRIEPGSILSFAVRIGSNIVIPRDSKVTLMETDEDANEVDLGPKAEGHIWVDSFSDDDDEEGDKKLLRFASLGYVRSDVEDVDDFSEEGSDEDEDGAMPENDPFVEIHLTVLRAIEEGHDSDDLTLELNTLKMAYNLDFMDLRTGAIPTFLERIEPSVDISAYVEKWGEVLKKFMFDESDQQHVMELLSENCLKLKLPQPRVNNLVKALYEEDILDEAFIFKWFAKTKGAFRDSLSPFVKWLRETESESESD
ncbi:hypothetical protein HDU67_008448 [Dinochytrium kinnereticum]|nr:hypothetical protein HDU67_008448 [Dinochytrium kinnereticum]